MRARTIWIGWGLALAQTALAGHDAKLASPDSVDYLVPGTYQTTESTWFDVITLSRWDETEEFYARVRSPEDGNHFNVDVPLSKVGAAVEVASHYAGSVELAMSSNGCPYQYQLQLYPYRDYVMVKLHFPDKVVKDESGQCHASGYRWHFLDRRYALVKADYARAFEQAISFAADEAERDLFALHLAAFTGDVAKVEALLAQSSVAVDAKDWNGLTPLAQAAAMGRGKVVELLVERGADIYAVDGQGLTAVDHFLMAQHTVASTPEAADAARVFWQAEPLTDADEVRLLTWAFDRGGDALFAELVGSATPSLALGDAALARLNQWLAGSQSVIDRQIARARAILTLPTSEPLRTAAFVRAIELGSTELAGLFVEQGVDINRPGQSGHTALASAVLSRNEALFDYVMKLSPDVNLGSGSDVRSPLAHAATFILSDDEVSTRMMDRLLKAGANINLTDRNGYTALDYVTTAIISVSNNYTWINHDSNIGFLVRVYKWLAGSGARHHAIKRPPPDYILNLA